MLSDPRELQAIRPTQSRRFHQLYQAHFETVMRFILRFGICRHDAEDLAQRVFMVAYRRSGDPEGIESPEAFLRAVTVRVIHEHFRWWKVRRAKSWLVEHSWAGRDEDAVDPERNLLAGESLEEVRSVLRKMSEKLRDAFVLLDIEGIPIRDAAEILGVPINTLRSRHGLAREEFKRLYARFQNKDAATKGHSL
jgi:RNA polymerase sigma factor (sigma-70 family)